MAQRMVVSASKPSKLLADTRRSLDLGLLMSQMGKDFFNHLRKIFILCGFSASSEFATVLDLLA